jgi:hypothetical protein
MLALASVRCLVKNKTKIADGLLERRKVIAEVETSDRERDT